MAFTCEGCGREGLKNENGIYEGGVCYTWAGKMICTKCRQSGVSQPAPENLRKFFEATSIRLDYNKDGTIIVPV
jgi:hypothetical protein